MKISKMMVVAVLVFAVSLAACAQPQNAQVPGTGQTMPTASTMMGTEVPGTMESTDAMAKTPDTMMGTPTGDAMMEKTPDAMMEATPDAMMEKPTEDAMMEKTSDAMMEKPTEETMMETTPGAMMEAPGWFASELTDAVTGKPFTINDYKGKVVVVYNAATGCADCLKQGQQLQTLVDMLGMDSNVVVVGLDGVTSDNAAALKSYVMDNHFKGNYAIAPQSVKDEIGKLYGAKFFDAATASVLIIDTKGEAHPLEAGVMDANSLKKAIEMYSGM